ncbi:CPBP family intramembrane metalloprotease [Sphingomonas sp. PL-96]|uniref:CPBP family intramembrane glutamic endopeptidase n=1 Tax=Sphingomonas sp. PL-96 TaxID=2887201 RepID=UPI001E36E96D|nr:CPBP family intramembrane glutamic endopeptidase [Sphingomonas sp. PL-96]MCC2975699.1 CPBP family intramembrane metalloprotease [Sphingomonas sp. PL-96]
MARARPIGLALLALAVAWLLLRVCPPLASGLANGLGPTGGELVFVLCVYMPLLLLAIGAGLLARTGALRLGGHPSARLTAGLALGVVGLGLAVAYCALAGTLQRAGGASVSSVLALGLVAIAVQVLAEEALFRGVVQPLLVRGLGSLGGVAGAAVAFAGLHAASGAAGPLVLVNMLLGGILFGYLALRSGGIAGAFGAHLAWNAGEQLGFGLDPNPGTGGFGALIDFDLVGAARWGGSEDGLNGSWAMALALMALLAFVLLGGRSKQDDRRGAARAA